MTDKNGSVVPAKFAAEELVDVTNRAAKDVEILMTANQEVMEKGFYMFQQYNQMYIDMMTSMMEQSFDQMLAFRARTNHILEDSLKRTQDLMVAEQTLPRQVADVFQMQIQNNAQYMAELVNSNSKMLTTTALFSNWASERVVKMFNAVPSNQ